MFSSSQKESIKNIVLEYIYTVEWSPFVNIAIDKIKHKVNFNNYSMDEREMRYELMEAIVNEVDVGTLKDIIYDNIESSYLGSEELKPYLEQDHDACMEIVDQYLHELDLTDFLFECLKYNHRLQIQIKDIVDNELSKTKSYNLVAKRIKKRA